MIGKLALRFLPDRLSTTILAVAAGAIIIAQTSALFVMRGEREALIRKAESGAAASCLQSLSTAIIPGQRVRPVLPPMPLAPPNSLPPDVLKQLQEIDKARAEAQNRATTGSGQLFETFALRFTESVPDGKGGTTTTQREFNVPVPPMPPQPADGPPPDAPQIVIMPPQLPGMSGPLPLPRDLDPSKIDVLVIPNADSRPMVQATRMLPDGSRINFSAPSRVEESMFSMTHLFSLGAVVAGVVLLSALMIGTATRPLQQLAQAAERIGRDLNAPELPEQGPREVRQAAAAFNRMQNRLKRFVEDRTRMLAAISHDLRTPLTRMRLRAEFMDEDLKDRMLKDLHEMESMIAATLDFAKTDAAGEATQQIDLFEMLNEIHADAIDAGLPMTLEATGPAPADLRPVAMKRAIVNLIENAVKYGGRADVSLIQSPRSLEILVADRGPGIPADKLADVFLPFVRVEDSRNAETGGTGLGLSVANDIVRSHGGEIKLDPRDGGGLNARIILPVG